MVSNRVSIGIAPDDLQVGDFVAAIDSKTKSRPRMMLGRDAEGDPMFVQMPEDPRDITPRVPHQMLGISWPWVVFGVLIPGGGIEGPVIRDLRKTKCMRLEDQYMDAIKSFVKPEHQPSSGEQTEQPVGVETQSLRG